MCVCVCVCLFILQQYMVVTILLGGFVADQSSIIWRKLNIYGRAII